MHDDKTITVIMPCYNQARFLGAALESLQNQRGARWNCVVVDDGSTDNSLAVAKWYASEDDRITVIAQEHRGPAAARNTGLDHATSDYIQFLDADDLLAPGKFARHLSALIRYDAQVAMCPPFVFRDDDPQREWSAGGRPSMPREGAMLEDLACGINLPVHCYLFDARLFANPKTRFDESLANHEDWECWMRVFARNPKVRRTDERQALYRRHESTMSADREAMRLGFVAAIDKAAQNFPEDDTIANLLAQTRQRLERGDYPDSGLTANSAGVPVRRRIGNFLRLLLPEKRVLQIRKIFYGRPG